MRASFSLGSVRGVPVGVDLSLLLLGALLTWSLAEGRLPAVQPGFDTAVYWSVAAVGAVAFFASVLAHELGHAIVARRAGLRVEGITLWILGGIARLDGEAARPRQELAIAAAGPGVSLALGAGFAAATWAGTALGLAPVSAEILRWLAVVNLVLAVFNLLPGAPLDGGRILAAVLWAWRRDRVWAGLRASQAGSALGAGMAGLGMAWALSGTVTSGLWLALIGWFLVSASRSEAWSWRTRQSLAGLRVRDLLRPDPPTVLGPPGQTPGAPTPATPEESLLDALDRVPPESPPVLVVWDQGRVVGWVHPEDVARHATRRRSPITSVGPGASGATETPSGPSTPAGTAPGAPPATDPAASRPVRTPSPGTEPPAT